METQDAALRLVFAMYLSTRDAARAAAVCRAWRDAARCSECARSLRLREEPAGGAALRALLQRRAVVPPAAALTSVDLEFARGVTDADIAQLAAAAPHLLRANLNAVKSVGDAAVAALAAGCHRLEVLTLYWNLSLTDAALQALAASPAASTLRELSLSGCKGVTDAGVAEFARCPKLAVLDVTRCVRLTDAALIPVALACPALERLICYATTALTDRVLRCLPALARLSELDLCGNQNITDEGLEHVGQCHRLETLNLTWRVSPRPRIGCMGVTDRGLAAVAAGCPRLAWLSLHGNRAITDATVAALAAAPCRGSLHTLDVAGCVGIEARAPAQLRERLPLLRCFLVHS